MGVGGCGGGAVTRGRGLEGQENEWKYAAAILHIF